jgi:hypothetical protein
LNELARSYAAFRAQEARERGGGISTSSGPDQFTQSDYTQMDDGKIIEVTITIRRDRDSIFLPDPPPLKVDDFKIEEKVAVARPGFPGGK